MNSQKKKKRKERTGKRNNGRRGVRLEDGALLLLLLGDLGPGIQDRAAKS